MNKATIEAIETQRDYLVRRIEGLTGTLEGQRIYARQTKAELWHAKAELAAIEEDLAALQTPEPSGHEPD